MAECDFPLYPTDGRLYCNATYDGVQCWNYTLAGTTAFGACPENHPASIIFDNPSGYSYRKCEISGIWWNNSNTGIHEFAKSNYQPCVSQAILEMHDIKADIHDLNVERIKLIMYIYISGYAVSILLLTIALAIFGLFKQLHCSRVSIHSNLFISYILSGSMWIVFYKEMSLSNFSVESRPTWCYVLHAFTQYTTLCNFAWMLSEGIFLHFCLVHVFSDKRKLLITCCVVGWVLPIFITGIYCIVRVIDGEEENHGCWLEIQWSFWILLIPIIISLLLNLIFLINILRIILSKIRSFNQRDSDQFRKTVRAILILVPLLGLQYILMPLNNDSFLYKIIVAIVTSYQGAVIAVLFCFLNSKVLNLIKRKIRTKQWCVGIQRLPQRSSIRSSSRKSSSSKKEEYDLTENRGSRAVFLPK
ncbi:calcitonin receptor-like [Saccostrea echinata]|uniref:calcitonin receptor-like n=1 Tax=Saccostrea echinata TaxID=191078 RepID=UPI002A7F6ED2|nr:calcitonin receptor-like [Saccostrea echinata]